MITKKVYIIYIIGYNVLSRLFLVCIVSSCYAVSLLVMCNMTSINVTFFHVYVTILVSWSRVSCVLCAGLCFMNTKKYIIYSRININVNMYISLRYIPPLMN